ncbi:TetR/AcrR family transcriptional regulator [Streptomyces sp. NPDC004609]|uniref:TetR/AcrR family transcriptional regulator n=1 Tax=Streptomyces sp. NPDC004609 TaxID=3364704 RepID=UPI0036A21520
MPLHEQHDERGSGDGAAPGPAPRAPAGPRPDPDPAPAAGAGAGAGETAGTGSAACADAAPASDSGCCGGARPGAARRGRPRSEAAERSIIGTVVRLLEEGVPLSELSIERIARTAGVGKATIYRRWEGKEALFVDVVRSIEPVDAPLPGTSVRDDLVAMIESLRRRGLAKRSSTLLLSIFAQMQAYPQLWDMYNRVSVTPRRTLLREILRRGVENGEIRADLDPDLLNDLFVGPMLVRTVLYPASTPAEGSAERIVDAVLSGVRPRK